MKKNKWLTIGIVLALAVAMIWAVPVFAQGRGRGQWGQGRGQGQAWGCPGGGPAGTCPAYPNYQQNRRRYGGNNPQANTARRGNQGNWGGSGNRNYQTNPQPSSPPNK